MASWTLENFPKIINVINKLIPTDYIFYSTDLKKVLWMDDSNYPLPENGKPGSELSNSSVAYKVIETRKALSIEIDAKLYGKPLKFVAVGTSTLFRTVC